MGMRRHAQYFAMSHKPFRNWQSWQSRKINWRSFHLDARYTQLRFIFATPDRVALLR